MDRIVAEKCQKVAVQFVQEMLPEIFLPGLDIFGRLMVYQEDTVSSHVY